MSRFNKKICNKIREKSIEKSEGHRPQGFFMKQYHNLDKASKLEVTVHLISECLFICRKFQNHHSSN